jgi:hypothetical protein
MTAFEQSGGDRNALGGAGRALAAPGVMALAFAKLKASAK